MPGKGKASERCVRRLELSDADYPAEIAALHTAPPVLYLCGRLPPAPRVAIIGSRRSDGYGLDMARSLAGELARAGVCVVNGGAAGVDTAALEAALEAGGRAVAVLGTSCDKSYPSLNRRLFDRLAREGALLSEVGPGTPSLPAFFSVRNRLISALADAVLVVRAAEKSGTLVTARYAVEQGRRLMALPGPAGQELSAGCHRLIRAGALLVESAEEILQTLGIRRPPRTQLPLVGPEEGQLDADERAAWLTVRGASLSIDQIGERSGLSSAQAAAALLRLELKGWVERRPGMVYVATTGGRESGLPQGGS